MHQSVMANSGHLPNLLKIGHEYLFWMNPGFGMCKGTVSELDSMSICFSDTSGIEMPKEIKPSEILNFANEKEDWFDIGELIVDSSSIKWCVDVSVKNNKSLARLKNLKF